jgi:hypothetical protein
MKFKKSAEQLKLAGELSSFVLGQKFPGLLVS